MGSGKGPTAPKAPNPKQVQAERKAINDAAAAANTGNSRAGPGQANRGFDFESRDAQGNIEGAKKGVPYSYNARTGESSGPVPGRPSNVPREPRNISINLNESLGFSDKAQADYVKQTTIQERKNTVQSSNQAQNKRKSYSVNLNEGLSVSEGPPTQVESGSPKSEKILLKPTPNPTPYIPFIEPSFKLEKQPMFKLVPPVMPKLISKGTSRYMFGPQGPKNNKINLGFTKSKESQKIEKSGYGIFQQEQTMLIPGKTIPRNSFNMPSNAAAAILPYTMASAYQDTSKFNKDEKKAYEKIVKNEQKFDNKKANSEFGISLKGEAIKATRGKSQPEIPLSDAIIVPGSIEYAVSENKKPLIFVQRDKELNPLGNRSDLIETVQRPVFNLEKYLAAAPEAAKRIIQTGDIMAGEKYFQTEVAPTLKKTASSRLFSNPLELLNPKKAPENIISASTEIAMYAFMGGGRGGKSNAQKIKIDIMPDPPYVSKNTYRSRQVPRDIFKEDKATASKFKETKIDLGKGIGLKFDPSSGGVNIGKSPPPKPPSTFRGTKIDLGKGTGKLPLSEIITKNGQILLEKTKQTPKQKTESRFKSYPVRLGEAEAKIVKQIQKQQTTIPKTTTKKKKPLSQSTGYVFQEETIRYPPGSAFKSEFKMTDQIATMLIPKQKSRQKQQQSFIISEIAKPKQKFDSGLKIKDQLTTVLTPKQTPRQKEDQIFTPVITTKTTPKLDIPIIPESKFFQPTPPRTTPRPPPRGSPFPPYFPSAYFGSGLFENPASLKKSFAAYGISSDINIKTLPTYSRYSSGTGIFKAQSNEDKRIQNLFYGKPRKKSKAKNKSKSKSRKR